MARLLADVLFTLGFEEVGCWLVDPTSGLLTYVLDDLDAATRRRILDTPNALYAFLRDDEVLYLGKTARSIRRRFQTYCKPGSRQSTNIKNNGHIRVLLSAGQGVRIAVFTPVSQLHYGDFEIDLAAGLENALIAGFDPPWNGRDGGQSVSESAEREIEEDEGLPSKESPSIPAHPAQVRARFQIRLGDTYYDRGIINPGADASRFLGKHGDPVLVCLGTCEAVVASRINRTANSSGAVRISGGNQQIAAWLQRHFARGDVVDACVLDSDRILLRAPSRSG